MKRVLITGGAGFIGSHLGELLLDKGYEVMAMDNLITGNINNLASIKNHPRFTFIEHDVTQFIDIQGEVNYILHFASPASPIDYLELPIQTLKVGALGTHNALGLARHKKAKFLLASSSEVYGDPLIHPQVEDYWGNVNPIGPRGVYDEAKRFAEAITLAYHRVHKVETHIARIFNTYGPRMRKKDGRVVPNFISQALSQESITVYGSGTQTRSFCYINDLVEGIFRLMNSGLYLPVNLGNPKETTILELARLIINLTDSHSKLVYKELPVDDPRVRQPDITRARKNFGWEPKISLEEGLKKTIAWFKS